MKNIKTILVVFSLVFSLPFVSKAQKVDSSYVRINDSLKKVAAPIFKKRETIKEFDSNTGKWHKQRWGKIYTMNGKEISEDEVCEQLKIFPSSSRQIRKFNKGSSVVIATGLIWMTSTLVDYFGYGISDINNKRTWNQESKPDKILFSVSMASMGTMLILMIAERQHLIKGIRLYNKEISKRNK